MSVTVHNFIYEFTDTSLFIPVVKSDIPLRILEKGKYIHYIHINIYPKNIYKRKCMQRIYTQGNIFIIIAVKYYEISV